MHHDIIINDGKMKRGSIWVKNLFGQRQGWLDKAADHLGEGVDDHVADEDPAQVQADQLAQDEDEDGEPWEEEKGEEVDDHAEQERGEWVGNIEVEVKQFFAWRQPTQQTWQAVQVPHQQIFYLLSLFQVHLTCWKKVFLHCSHWLQKKLVESVWVLGRTLFHFFGHISTGRMIQPSSHTPHHRQSISQSFLNLLTLD